jgi:Alcohol acetyltransferase
VSWRSFENLVDILFVSTNCSGNCERYNISRNHVRSYNNVGTTASYEIPEQLLEECPLETVIYAALRNLIGRHPALGITILDEHTTTPSFARLAKIDLRKVVQFEKLDSGENAPPPPSSIETAHRQPFEKLGDLPLWRVIVIEHPKILSDDNNAETIRLVDVCFFAHHSICDGESCISFHLTFSEAINDIGDIVYHSSRSGPVVIPPKLDLPPSIEEAHRLPLSFFFLLKQLYKMLFPSKPDPLHWTGPSIFSEPNTTCLRTMYLPVSITDSLINQCRKNKTSFTSLLLVVIARILAENYLDYHQFTSKTAMSFRRFTKINKRDMGCYVSSIRHSFSSTRKRGCIPCDGEFSWEDVRATKRVITTSTSTAKNNGIALLRYLNDYTSWLKQQIGGKRPDSFEVSNLGMVDASNDRDYKVIKIKRILFSQSSNVLGPPYVFSVVSLKGGELAIALDWQEGIVEVDLAERIFAALESELRRLARGDES